MSNTRNNGVLPPTSANLPSLPLSRLRRGQARVRLQALCDKEERCPDTAGDCPRIEGRPVQQLVSEPQRPRQAARGLGKQAAELRRMIPPPRHFDCERPLPSHSPVGGRIPSAGRSAGGGPYGSTPVRTPPGAATGVPAAAPAPESASRTVFPCISWSWACFSLLRGSIEIPRYHSAPLKERQRGGRRPAQNPRGDAATMPASIGQLAPSLDASASACQATGTASTSFFRRLRALGGVTPLSQEMLFAVMLQVDGSINIAVDNQATAVAFIHLLVNAAASSRSWDSHNHYKSANWQSREAP